MTPSPDAATGGPPLLTRRAAKLRGEVPADALEAFRTAGGAVFPMLPAGCETAAGNAAQARHPWTTRQDELLAAATRVSAPEVRSTGTFVRRVVRGPFVRTGRVGFEVRRPERRAGAVRPAGVSLTARPENPAGIPPAGGPFRVTGCRTLRVGVRA